MSLSTVVSDSPALKGWHLGEVAIQSKMNFADAISPFSVRIRNEMPDQHREFHATRLPFMPTTILDEEGRPWGCILAGANGEPGFIQATDARTIKMELKVWEGDPLSDIAGSFADGEKLLAAGIGIEFTTRRRNKWAGRIEKIERRGDRMHLSIHVNEAGGNCPKYINIRDVIAHPKTSPKVAYKIPHLKDEDRLPDEVVDFILRNDTVFIGTTYVAPEAVAKDYPSHLGMNQRGGRAGFVRVRMDGRTIVVPDFSGNRHMCSLGNIEVTPLAALTFISFENGGVLYTTGTAKNYVGPESQKIMPLQNALTTVHVTGFTFVRDALPVRSRAGSIVDRSPYSPPIRFLAEETKTKFFDQEDECVATLTSMEIHSDSLVTFSWATSKPVKIIPGQAAVLDFSSMVGNKEYQHMSNEKPSAVNDDRIRTWTVSSAHPDEGTNSFKLTMREKPGGLVTSALFNLAREAAEKHPAYLADARVLKINAKLVGIQGEFTLADEKEKVGKPRKLLWIAGGIGLTPFLSMLGAMASEAMQLEELDIRLALSTREPDVLMGLVVNALGGKVRKGINLTVDLFSSSPTKEWVGSGLEVNRHEGRITADFFKKGVPDVSVREVYVCGSPTFEEVALNGLKAVGVPDKKVIRENFVY